MAKDDSWYVLKSSARFYYLETLDSISWVSNINKATRYSRLQANLKKAKLKVSFSNQLLVTLEKVEDKNHG